MDNCRQVITRPTEEKAHPIACHWTTPRNDDCPVVAIVPPAGGCACSHAMTASNVPGTVHVSVHDSVLPGEVGAAPPPAHRWGPRLNVESPVATAQPTAGSRHRAGLPADADRWLASVPKQCGIVARQDRQLPSGSNHTHRGRRRARGQRTPQRRPATGPATGSSRSLRRNSRAGSSPLPCHEWVSRATSPDAGSAPGRSAARRSSCR